MSQLTIFKPNKNITGGAFSFNYNADKDYAFLKVAPQIAEMPDRDKEGPEKQKVFGWEDKAINVKLNTTDLSKLITVILGIVSMESLFHQTSSDNKIVELSYVPVKDASNPKDQGGFRFKVSQKVQGEDKPNGVIIGVSHAEAVQIRLFAEDAIIGIQKCQTYKK